MKRIIFLMSLLVVFANSLSAQTDSTKTAPKVNPIDSVAPAPTSAPTPKQAKEEKWYDKLHIRGYAQFRYNRLLATNDNLRCDQCDRSIGAGGGIFMRRARLVFYGNVHEYVYIYIQADFAQNATNGGTLTVQNFFNIRDAYGDIYLNKKKTFRTRIGVSKVPYSFENAQSSQNRIAFDRTDAINSAAFNERDMGVFFMFTPIKIRDRFKMLVSEGLKGSGDYGMIAGGIYNGQTLNRLEMNDSMFVVGRVAYPFLVGKKQILELGASTLYGYYNLKESRSTVVTGSDNQLSQRVDVYAVLFPQPFGIQVEYNWGKGPEFFNNNGVYSMKVQSLQGGYAQLMYRQKIKGQYFIPYVRYQYYDGGKPFEKDARSYTVKDWEMGVEWTPIKAVEVTAAYAIMDRRYEDSAKPLNTQTGNMLRLQLQFNY